MVKFATQYEVDNFKDYDFRLLTPLDALEFSRAQNESYQEISNYFDPSFFSKPKPFLDNFNALMIDIRSHEVDIFGLFRGNRLLGIGSYEFTKYSDNGCQVVIWMRTSEAGKKIGAYFLKKLTLCAIYEKKFRFVELLIDQSNLASRKIALNVGYEHIETFAGDTSGRLASGKYCHYICFDGEIDALSKEYNKRKMDLIDHPAYKRHFRDLILDEGVNDIFKWPYPVKEKPKKKRPVTSKYKNVSLSRDPIPRY